MRISDWSSDVCSSDLCDADRLSDQHAGLCGRQLPFYGFLQGRYSPDDHSGPGDLHCDSSVGLIAVAHRRMTRRGAVKLQKSVQGAYRSEEHTSELQSLMRISYAVFCLQKKKNRYTSSNTAHN